MKINEETDEVILDNHDYTVINEIQKYMKFCGLHSSECLSKSDFKTIASYANTKAGHVKAIVENIEI